jgi:hypothetical protein
MLQVAGHCEHHKLVRLDDGCQQVSWASHPANLKSATEAAAAADAFLHELYVLLVRLQVDDGSQ